MVVNLLIEDNAFRGFCSKAWYSGDSKIISEVFLNNGNAAYRKEVWLENKFDEELTGLEDIDLGKKAKANNWQIFYCAEANVEHLHKENFKTILNRYRREAEAMKNINKDFKSDEHIIKNTFSLLKRFSKKLNMI